jgi:hypothetical protein
VARVLGPRANVVGIDLSGLLIGVARDRANREGVAANFVCADAQTLAFQPAGFDLMISRFGVMFFDDPVAAFTNLRRAARDACALRLVVFRSIAENPFMTTAERAAASILPALPPRKPDAPGQFAFADRDRVKRILDASGWAGVDILPLDKDCAFPQNALVRYFTHLGPLSQVLRSVDEETRTRAIAQIRAGFEPFVQGAQVRFTAACWMIKAEARTG